MGQMLDKTRDQMNNWMWHNPRGCGDQVNRSNPQTTGLGKIKCAVEHSSWYGRDDLRAKIEPQSCRQYKPGDLLAVKPLNSDEIINEDDDDENWVDPGAPSGGWSHPGHDNDDDHGEGEEDMQGGEKGTGKGMGSMDQKGKGKATDDRMGKRKGKGKGNGSGKGIVLATVLDRQFRSGTRSEPNRCQIGGPGCQYTRTINSGPVRCKSPNPSELGGLSAGRPAGPSVDLYNVLVFAAG